MIKKFLTKIRRSRNFWFLANFDEIRILYVAYLIRNFAVNITTGFVFMYFYKVGYGWLGVLGFLTISYVIKLFGLWVAGFYIAKNGPKHGILLSNLLHIPMMICVALVGKFGIIMAILAVIIQGFAIAMNNISQYVSFSKVKDVKRAGRQASILYIIQKITAIISPLVGGWMAVQFGAEPVMLLSAVMFVFSAVPLLSTREVIKSNIKLEFKTFPVKKYLKNIFLPQIYSSAPSSTIHYVWSVFVPIFIFSKDNPYGVMGTIASLSAVFSIFSAVVIGKIIDKKFGGEMLRISLILRGLVEIARGLLVNSVIGVILSRFIDDFAGSGYSLANRKGSAFEADMSGRRIEFFVISESFFFLGSLAYSVMALILFLIFGAELGIRIFMVVAGVVLVLFGKIKYSVFEK